MPEIGLGKVLVKTNEELIFETKRGFAPSTLVLNGVRYTFARDNAQSDDKTAVYLKDPE